MIEVLNSPSSLFALPACYYSIPHIHNSLMQLQPQSDSLLAPPPPPDTVQELAALLRQHRMRCMLPSWGCSLYFSYMSVINQATLPPVCEIQVHRGDLDTHAPKGSNYHVDSLNGGWWTITRNPHDGS
ncbi:hypothetical protein LCI18_011854 [Fusarium solani-melongenae]|uniref:Uncharacterized protein n=1 Tax=Fusarium solani subsp. cucurbitae TaxID=2747967 RepID=A0ACD3ZHZ0_FUSSC|nr:hypothetical protein LCI18_011854 [Fusarium solani-melongenae]